MLDLAILGDPSQVKSSLTVNNTACTGIYLLTQKVMMVLFRDVGNPANLGMGTTIIQEAIANNIAEPEWLSGQFNIAMARVREVLNATIPSDSPADEKLKDLRVQVNYPEDVDNPVVASRRGMLIATITVTSQAGDTVSVPIPVDSVETSET